MDLANKLHLLLEVSKAGSFAKAADGMNIDRSVLSKHIKQLEEHLGVRLLNRTTRSLSLTQVGKQIVEKADQISQLLDDTQQIRFAVSQSPSKPFENLNQFPVLGNSEIAVLSNSTSRDQGL